MQNDKGLEYFHGQPTHFPNNEACLWLCQMVYAEVMF
jgi:hypothetical protein